MKSKELSEIEFKGKIFEHIDKGLIERLKSLRPISETESIKTEMIRRLIVSIKKFNENSSIQTSKIIKLT